MEQAVPGKFLSRSTLLALLRPAWESQPSLDCAAPSAFSNGRICISVLSINCNNSIKNLSNLDRVEIIELHSAKGITLSHFKPTPSSVPWR